ncbi:MotA/TolQ/ExbB proton channel family protein [Pelagicoccus sp. SDUM812002]|uniref:MotA/TolQ/ExbB proton channel family protein n=1 Tax=Pelagicoccus sp. SDUM812002 TaxID=3041266 RepID=UPI00280D402D|nr:MotA/TolQ/ExbB proton channel family protein [Pelagicoccus sp. SDUM812002]MDQ8187163.1 MotA/TolQ/ExbB proton channel family protein [Pelagicoccus sp. SDUM812002]
MRSSFRARIHKRLRFSRVLTVAAPLLGLLGTVMGMLNTFNVLSQEKSADTATSVAEGISMALVTTQAGLMVALPALFLTEWIKQLSKRSERMFFAQSSKPSTLT